MSPTRTKPVALTIAGSDSGGGAGIQADIKAMEANGVFATSVIAAVTAQNTQSVSMAYNMPANLVAAQIDAVANDFDIAAVKTGMLSSSKIIKTVAEKVDEHDLAPLVVDPVMVSKSGFRLLQQDATDTLRDLLIPLATLVTPNVHEAAILAEMRIDTLEDAKEAARVIFDLGPEAVLVKGGHLEDQPDSIDIFFDGNEMKTFEATRIDTMNTHGTGCTFASAIAANLAHGHEMEEAIRRAKHYVTEALRHALPLGHKHGPTNHFYHLDANAVFSTESKEGAAHA